MRFHFPASRSIDHGSTRSIVTATGNAIMPCPFISRAILRRAGIVLSTVAAVLFFVGSANAETYPYRTFYSPSWTDSTTYYLYARFDGWTYIDNELVIYLMTPEGNRKQIKLWDLSPNDFVYCRKLIRLAQEPRLLSFDLPDPPPQPPVQKSLFSDLNPEEQRILADKTTEQPTKNSLLGFDLPPLQNQPTETPVVIQPPVPRPVTAPQPPQITGEYVGQMFLSLVFGILLFWAVFHCVKQWNTGAKAPTHKWAIHIVWLIAWFLFFGVGAIISDWICKYILYTAIVDKWTPLQAGWATGLVAGIIKGGLVGIFFWGVTRIHGAGKQGKGMPRFKIVRTSGNIFLGAGFALIIICSIVVLAQKGVMDFVYLFSPFNIVNFVAMVVVLLPGIFLRSWANRLEERYKAQQGVEAASQPVGSPRIRIIPKDAAEKETKGDISARLLQLKELEDKGFITTDEYDRKRKEIIAEL